MIHKERNLMNGQFCPETHPEVTTLQNIFVISWDDGLGKLWSRMTCKEMETTFFQKSFMC